MRSSTATAARRALLDVAMTTAMFFATAALVSHGLASADPRPTELAPLGLLLVAGTSLPLLLWRRLPLGVFTATAIAGALLAGFSYTVDLLPGPVAALYALAAGRDDDKSWTTTHTAVVIGLLVTFLGADAVANGAFPGLVLLHTGLAWSVAWFAGERTRLRREHIADLSRRALRADQDAERDRQLAAAEERARIGRDMHDSVGHAINVIAVRAGAARLRHAREPDRSVVALVAIEELARQTAEEIDHLVGTLREGRESERVEAPVCLASLNTLVAWHEASGMQVSVEVEGTPRTVEGPVDQAAYRILQEALTNAARHGTGQATVRLAYDEDGVHLTVVNPLGDGSTPARLGGGHGLVGMRERTQLLDGVLQVDSIDGCFRVRAHLPVADRHP